MNSIFKINQQIIIDNTFPKSVLLLGGSGSIGRQTFELCVAQPEKFRVKSIISGNNVQETIRQAKTVQPEFIVMATESAARAVQSEISNVKVLFGDLSKKEVIATGHDIAITAIPGLNGLISTFDAIQHSKVVAFANKEVIVYTGELLLKFAQKYNTAIIPIDSEHHAIFQILHGLNNLENVKKIVLTASGGPFLHRKNIKNVSIEDVLNHPTWRMGSKISVDCATLFNKALEVIEASYLFGMNLNDIEAIIHSESVVHGIIELKSGEIFMHASASDMKIPINAALNWPQKGSFYIPLNLTSVGRLNFQNIDHSQFPMFNLCIDAAKHGIITRIAVNYANELAVEMFLNSQIQFHEIYHVVNLGLNSSMNFKSENIFDTIDTIQSICTNVKMAIQMKY